jgi:hypothetical protein
MLASQVEPTGVTHPELASFTRQLGAMLHAGVNVLRALRIASQHSGNQALIEASVTVSRALEDGKEFHQAIARYPDLFGPFYVEMARQGEIDGMLGQALLGVADYLDHLAAAGAPLAEPHPVPVAAPATPPLVATTVMMTLGVLALGAAGVGALAAFQVLDERWLTPLAAAWAGVCLLAGGWLLRRVTPATQQPATSPLLPRLPPKSAQRRAAETEGIVRSALQEQAEEEELATQARLRVAPEAAYSNGRSPNVSELLLPPDERTPPRFDL